MSDRRAPGPERSPSVAQSLREAAAGFAAVSDSPRLDAELLMAEALGVTRSELLLRRQDMAAPPAFAALAGRRASGEPVAYILGRREFYGLELAVTPGVLIPRPDSETLVEAARTRLETRPPHRVLDLGTGSGALLLAALSLWPDAQGVGTDRSPEALAVAGANADRLGLGTRTRLIERDWCEEGWRDGLGRFDLILANPPYVEDDAPLAAEVRDHEPAGALFAGAEGLDAYRVLFPQLPALLAPRGLAVVEIGASQAAAVGALAAAQGFEAALERDLAARPRALVLTIPLGSAANSR